jgi:hypothetical protein
MIAIGTDITRLFSKGYNVKPGLIQWIMVIAGSAAILYSFMSDVDAGFYEKYPEPYSWVLLATGLVLFIAAYLMLHKKSIATKKS